MFDSMRVRVRVFFKAKRGLLLGPGPVFFFGVYVFRCAFSLSSSSSSSSVSISLVIKVLFLIFDRSESASVNERCYARKIVHTLSRHRK